MICLLRIITTAQAFILGLGLGRAEMINVMNDDVAKVEIY